MGAFIRKCDARAGPLSKPEAPAKEVSDFGRVPWEARQPGMISLQHLD
jgi:hypothetical protein